jgi:hypothetical protein
MSMPYPIREIPGMSTDIAEILKKEGIRTTNAFLRATRTPRQRMKMAKKAGINIKLVLEMATACDRMRIRSVGSGYAQLLGLAGVKTVSDLKLRNPQHLAKSLENANDGKLVRVLPKEKMVGRWIENAKKLPAVIRY